MSNGGALGALSCCRVCPHLGAASIHHRARATWRGATLRFVPFNDHDALVSIAGIYTGTIPEWGGSWW